MLVVSRMSLNEFYSIKCFIFVAQPCSESVGSVIGAVLVVALLLIVLIIIGTSVFLMIVKRKIPKSTYI